MSFMKEITLWKLILISLFLMLNLRWTYQQPYGRSTFWECNFEVDSCLFRNQHNLAKFERYYNTMRKFLDSNGLLILNLHKPSNQRYPGARLISHYFPSGDIRVCLQLSYYSKDDGPSSFFVIQQDKENKCIFADHNLPARKDRWHDIEIQLDLSDGDPRFFLEVHTKKGRSGYFALRRFTWMNGECRRPEPNLC